MIRRLLRLCKKFRELEKNLEREAALTASLGRYIEALEGRDRERAAMIEELEVKNRSALAVLGEALETAAELKTRLDGLRPNHKEEEL